MKQELLIPKNAEKVIVEKINDKIIIEFEPKFKKGDIVFCESINTHYDDCMVIVKGFKDGKIEYYVKYNIYYWSLDYEGVFVHHYAHKLRYTTKEEKQEFFNILDKHDKIWNEKTLKLENIKDTEEKPIDGDIVIAWNGKNKHLAIIGILENMGNDRYPFKIGGIYYSNAIKFYSIEQFQSIRKTRKY